MSKNRIRDEYRKIGEHIDKLARDFYWAIELETADAVERARILRMYVWERDSGLMGFRRFQYVVIAGKAIKVAGAKWPKLARFFRREYPCSEDIVCGVVVTNDWQNDLAGREE